MVKRFKYLVFVFLMLHQLCTDAASPAKNAPLDSYLIEQVVISGSTNINSFQLIYNEENYSEISSNTEDILSDLVKLSIPVQKIEAESTSMKKDFLKMVNADKYPIINIALTELITSDFSNSTDTCHQINLTMNGITKSYTCFPSVEKDSFGNVQLSGNLNVKLSEFNIQPPKKIMGLIKVENEVFISFKVLFSTDDNIAKN